MNNIKPIPTEYNGIMYRSKLEAKWAAYFDLCGAKFEYEPQAFDLGDGIKYLPDFCVKDVLSVHGQCSAQTLESSTKYPEFWFECKGVMSDYDQVKINRFTQAISVPDEDYGYLTPRCPFYVLDRTPLQMFKDFNNCNDEAFSFYDIDCDEYPFTIGKLWGRDGIGLFGFEGNYICLMDRDSKKFATQVEGMFRWNPAK